MIRRYRRMRRRPTQVMTRLAVAGRCMTGSRSDQVAVAVMTVGAACMRRCIYKRISMARCTVVGAGGRYDG